MIPVNDPPVAVDDIVQIVEDSPKVFISPLGNDLTEPDVGESLQLLSVESLPGLIAVGNTLEYSPPLDFFGKRRVEYTISDGNGGQALGIIEIDVLPSNDPPRIVDEYFLVNGRGGSVRLDVLSNDSIEPDSNETLSLTSFNASSELGTITRSGDVLLLEPTGFFEGILELVYSVSDGNGGVGQGVATIELFLPNRDPVALADHLTLLEDEVQIIDVLANDTAAPDMDEVLSLVSVGKSREGGETMVEGGLVRYLPPENYFGNDRFTYEISDGRGGFAIAEVVLSIENVNDPPTVLDDQFEILEDSAPIVFDLLKNDSSNPDFGESLSLETFRIETSPFQGTASIQANQLAMSFEQDFNGLVTGIYEVADGNGGRAFGQVSVLVESVNDPPLANLDFVTILPGSEIVEIDVLANDSIAPDKSETLEIATLFTGELRSGEVSHDGETIFFRPFADARGTESFRYSISDGNGGQSSALIVLSIEEDRLPLLARDDQVSLLEDSSVRTNVLANDQIDTNNAESIELTIVALPKNGTVKVVEKDLLEYSANPDFFRQRSARV